MVHPLGSQPAPGAPGSPSPPTVAERFDEWLAALERKRDHPAAIGVVVVAMLVAVGAGWWWLTHTGPAPPVEALVPMVSTTEVGHGPAPTEGPPEPVVVHVSGAVERPGVYVLEHGERVIDAVAAAGGAVAGSDLHQLNLAAPVIDGLRIEVPLLGEIVAVPAAPSAEGPVDVNRAGPADLERLPGVGPATAAAIVAHRDEFGPFASVDALLDVPGIGPAKIDALRDLAIAS